MTTINDLAHEFNVEPHVIFAFGNLDNSIGDNEELNFEDVNAIREAWYSIKDEE